MALPGVQFQISADVIRLRQDLDKAQAQIDAFARAGGTAIGTLREAFIGLGSAVTLGALIAGIKGSIDTLDALGDASQATGASIENLSKTQKVAATYGHDFASVQAAVSRAVQGMIDPASSGAHALQALGISGKTAAGGLRDPIDVLLDVARNLGQYQDSAEKVALVTDLLGRNGAALLPMLNDMADHFDDVGAASAAASQQAQDFNDSVGRLQQQVRDLGQDVATQLLPSLSDSVELLGSMGSAADTTRGQTTGLQAAMTAFNVVLETAIVLGRNVSYVFEQAGNEIGGIAAQIGAVMQGNFGGVSAIRQQMQADAAAARQKLDMLDDLTLKTREYQQAQRDLANTADPRFDKQYATGSSSLSYTGDAEAKAKAAAAKAAAQKALADAQRTAQQFAQLQDQIMGKSADVEPKFYDNLRLIATQGAKAGLTLQQIIALQGQYIQQQPFAIKLEQDKTKAAQTALDLQLKAAQAQLDVESKLRAAQGLPQSRADIARQYDDQRSLFIAQGNTSALGSLDKLINTQAAQAQFEALSKTWQQATGGMTAALDLLKAKADSGLITQQAYAQSVADLQKQVSPSLAALLPQLQSVAGALGPEAQATVQQYAAALVRLQNQVNPVLQALGNSIETNFGNAFADMVTGAKSAKEAFSGMATSILSDMARLFAQRAASNLIGSLFGGFGGGAVSLNAAGGVYASPSLSAYSGTVVDKPTLFAFAHGAGLMGEAGAEAILPLRRGSDGKLGVQAQGAATQSISVSVAVDARGTQVSSDSAQGQKVGVQLANVVKAVIINEMRPGGALAGVK